MNKEKRVNQDRNIFYIKEVERERERERETEAMRERTDPGNTASKNIEGEIG